MLNLDSILYVIMAGKSAEIHITGGVVYRTRMTLGELESRLGKAFIKVHRGCIVSAMAIYDVTDRINLSNGKSLEYAKRKKARCGLDLQIWKSRTCQAGRRASERLVGSSFASLFENMDFFVSV
ncbi:MAG: LytTR family DNA-binding domain-containing protein [Bacillota bacterium]|nr:LytTR family DNA-binding domain-containing protein [Bacillota bacterium]